jgi:hypothetical protein
LHQREQVVDDYVKTELRHEVKSIVVEEVRTRRKWITIGIIVVFTVYVGLALWIGYIVNDVKVANDLRIDVARKEAETDSLKRAKIREFDKKYDESLKTYYNDIRKHNGTYSK